MCTYIHTYIHSFIHIYPCVYIASDDEIRNRLPTCADWVCVFLLALPLCKFSLPKVLLMSQILICLRSWLWFNFGKSVWCFVWGCLKRTTNFLRLLILLLCLYYIFAEPWSSPVLSLNLRWNLDFGRKNSPFVMVFCCESFFYLDRMNGTDLFFWLFWYGQDLQSNHKR
jgi:hypothetical protein